MKTLFKYLIPAALALLVAAACEDHRSDDMEDFQTMVYFRNGGEQDLTLFRTGEEGLYKIPICKSGRNLQGVIDIVLMPFDQAQLSMYNIRNECEYMLIPSTCYRFVDENGAALTDQSKIELSFGASDAYKIVYLSVDTQAVSALQENDPEASYVMAFQIFSNGKVSADINYILLKPSVDVPQLAFLSPGVEVHTYTGTSQMSETYRNTVSLNMDENRWDFTCKLEVKDAAWLKSYNASHGTAYELLPSALYKLPESTLSFAKGVTEVAFDVTITRDGMDMMKEYVLPIVLASCSKKEFVINEDKSVYLLNVRLDPDQITLTESMISVSTSQTGDGGGAAALIDGDEETYWHSTYSTHDGDPTYGEYIDISLNVPLNSIVLRYCTRHNNNNGVPTHIVVYVRNESSENWTQLGEEATDEMFNAAAQQWITLTPLKSEKSFKQIRVAIVESKAGDLRLSGTTHYTALGELQLFGTN